MLKDGFEYEDRIYNNSTSLKAVRVEHGLDYSTPKSVVTPGSLLDCQNYEMIGTNGIRSGGSYFRWDGSQDVQSEQIFYLRSNSAAAVIGSTCIGSTLYTEQTLTKTGKAIPFGVMLATRTVSSTEKYIYYFRIDSRYEPTIGDDVRANSASAVVFTFPDVVNNPSKVEDQTAFPGYTIDFASESAVSARNLAGYIRDYFQDRGSFFYNGPCPFWSYGMDGTNFNSFPQLNIVGAHYLNDRAYTAADLHLLYLKSLGTQVFPGDFVTEDETLDTFQVLDVQLISGAWGGATASDTAVLSVKDTSNPSVSTLGYKFSFQSGPKHHSVLTTKTYTLARTGTACGTGTDINNSYPARMAGLYRSYTEKQALESGSVAYVEITGAGSGYNSCPVVTSSGGNGTGFVGQAIVSAGSVIAVLVLNPGSGYTSAPAITITGASGDAGIVAATATAIMYDHQMSGQRFVDTGWVVNYNKGNSASNRLNVIDRRKAAAGQTTTLTTGTTDITDATIVGNGKPQYVAALQFDGSNTSSRGWGSISAAGLQSNADGSAGPNTALNSTFANNDYRTTTLTFGQFKNTTPSIATGSVITGFSVVLDYDITGTTFPAAVNSFKARMCLVKLKPNPANPNLPIVERISPFRETSLTTPIVATTAGTLTVGSSTDLWGLSGTTIDSLTADGADIGVALDIYINKVDAFDMGFIVDKITLAVSYNSPSVTYYFADTTTVAQRNVIAADLVNYQIEKGKFSTGDAQGVMQIATLRYVEQYNTTPKHNIRSGWSVYADASLSVKVAEVTADMTYNGLDSRQDLVDNDSRYQIISANFYADEEWEAIYGVTGAGRAWYFDGVYFARIYAIPLSETNSDTKDVPRHIAFYRYHLALGYKPGTVQFSVLGEPENFSGIDGASSHAPGDRVTGMAVLPGAYLAVFCENSIWGIFGTTVSEFELRTLVPNTGAIEFTVETLGSRPIFTSAFGIYWLQQVQEYGDFAGEPLSDAITQKLIPRLQRIGSVYDSSEAGCVVCSYIVRSRNQYRLWFKDGRQLVMSLVGPELRPEFTWLYTLLVNDNADQTIPFVPLALTSRIDNQGVERILAAPDIPLARIASTNYSLPDFNSGLYQMDKWWGFDNYHFYYALPAFATLNYLFNENPGQDFSLMGVRTEGATRNCADISVSTSGPYDEDGFSMPQPLVLAGSEVGIPLDYRARSDYASVAEVGRNVLIKYENYSANNQNTSLSNLFNATKAPQPPHYIQLLLLTIEQGKEDA